MSKILLSILKSDDIKVEQFLTLRQRWRCTTISSNSSLAIWIKVNGPVTNEHDYAMMTAEISYTMYCFQSFY